MPTTVGAIRKLRSDGRKTVVNARIKRALRLAVGKFKKTKTAKNLVEVYRRADRAAKSGVIKKGRADRIKGRLTRMVATKKLK
ncbi:hypothetical protein A2634_00780 [Candidatus Amesbacteria bacterium RIFCSPHIGHO2_01_FULL_48_32]|uniref:Small ribosomal subunit protein bS20 n=1 Tax=Candidatus Amesbacteria bacterium RIFCSPLOWO2_01_FULL_48_25 TaxID=1797259 RepID=A0A1F4ZAE0_9BACT|nr:MAG: hypothetical protein A2634_00780 [Candidatus Amesbacteria bacterium RIFCSPHIGHO2_01_FULL_48_32]OGD03340.1 MAG: hypothetical protein A2989_00730 [Candidatus Amesbacteria bacterium RIFCSPLOWO2_01_FULL_48_25]HJZ05294.1 30S ribosomal protein S20 [Patescibacteria group bacterium]